MLEGKEISEKGFEEEAEKGHGSIQDPRVSFQTVLAPA